MVPEHQQTKITMTVWEDLFTLFSKKLDSCFIKRDAFLNHIIRVELDNLKKGLAGRKNSLEAKRYISSKIKDLETKTINVVVDKDVAKDLNSIVREHNLVRDAFINRLLLLLSFPEVLLSHMFDVQLTRVVDDVELELESPARTFIDSLTFTLNAPNFYIQKELDIRYGANNEDLQSNLYTKAIDLLGIIEKTPDDRQREFFLKMHNSLIAFSCYAEDSEVPNTDAWKEKQNLELAKARLDDVLKGLDLPNLVKTKEGQ